MYVCVPVCVHACVCVCVTDLEQAVKWNWHRDRKREAGNAYSRGFSLHSRSGTDSEISAAPPFSAPTLDTHMTFSVVMKLPIFCVSL